MCEKQRIGKLSNKSKMDDHLPLQPVFPVKFEPRATVAPGNVQLIKSSVNAFNANPGEQFTSIKMRIFACSKLHNT